MKVTGLLVGKFPEHPLKGFLWAANVSIKFAFDFLVGLRIHVLSQLTKRKDLALKYGGKWAVVTGASEGIGKAFACELARTGMNIVLMSRSTQKLEKVAEAIEKEFKVQTRIIQVDFGLQDVYANISSSLEGLEIGILVNNVGVMYDYPQYFLDVPDKKLYDLINVNMTSVIMMTHIVLPHMCKRKRGAIINMSSSAGLLPTPQIAAYAATKEFVDSFSRALAYEYSSQGVEVQSLRPFYIATAMTYGTKPNVFVPSPETYVKNALRTLELSTRNTGYWNHEIQAWFLGFCPEWLWMWAGSILNQQIRRNVLKTRR